MKHWTSRSNERNVLKNIFLMIFSTCKSCILIKSFSFIFTTPDPELTIYFFYGIIDLTLSITTNFLELKCRFYQPVLDYKHLIHELQTFSRKEQAEHIFTGVINNFRCPCEKLSNRAHLLIFSTECISTPKKCYLSLFYVTTVEKI